MKENRHITLEEVIEEQLKDPEFAKAYEEEKVISEIEWVNSFQPGMWASKDGKQKPIEGMPLAYMANCVNKLNKLRLKLSLCTEEQASIYIAACYKIDDKIKDFKKHVIVIDGSQVTQEQIDKLSDAFGSEFIKEKIKSPTVTILGGVS